MAESGTLKIFDTRDMRTKAPSFCSQARGRPVRPKTPHGPRTIPEVRQRANRWNHDYLTVGDERPDVSFRECGYLFLATTPQGRDVLLENHATQRRHGITDVAALTPEALAARFPWMNTDGVTGETLGLKHEGAFDPYSLLQAFKKKARSLGVTYLAEEVVGLRHADRRISEVVTGVGSMGCGTVVNAAGAWARGIAAMVNIDLPVFPRPRSVFVFTCPVAIPDLPLLIDPDGFYVRPDGPNYVCGMKPPDDRDLNSHDFDVDYRWFDEELWPRLARWVPAFESHAIVGVDGANCSPLSAERPSSTIPPQSISVAKPMAPGARLNRR
jgi:glycine/D-amino acid oxidase-like deaminating enzyme